jgi:hypothetical protein
MSRLVQNNVFKVDLEKTFMKKSLALIIALGGIVWLVGQEDRRRGPGGEGRGSGGPVRGQPSQAEKVDLPDAQSKIYVEGEYRFIESNGVPDHDHGKFPRRGNPHTILPQTYKWRVPANPEGASELTELGRRPFGTALNGIPFDPGTAEYWNNDRNSDWRYEALSGHLKLGVDDNNAHVQPTGAYHYHGLPIGVILNQGSPDRMTMVGYAADEFPVYANYGYKKADDPKSGLKKMQSSWSTKSGTRPEKPEGPGGAFDGRFVADYEYVEGQGDLDESNGRFGPTPEHPDGIYHYYIVEQFPFIPRKFKGTPDESFSVRGAAGPPRGGGPGGRPGGRRGPRRGGEGGPPPRER